MCFSSGAGGAFHAPCLRAVTGTAVASITFPSSVLGWVHVETQELCLHASFLSMCYFEVGLKPFSMSRVTGGILVGFLVKKGQKMECAVELHVS